MQEAVRHEKLTDSSPHNHKSVQKHICSVCHVVFRRHDLLSRHIKMHSQSGSGRGTLGRTRLRSHSACDNCRNSRVKCSGRSPCDQCDKINRNCSFSADRSRLSADSGMQRTVTYAAQPTTLTSHSCEIEVGSVALSYTPMLSEGRNVPSTTDADAMISQHFGINEGYNPWTPPTPAWPWLHESMFLQDSTAEYWPLVEFADPTGQREFQDNTASSCQDESISFMASQPELSLSVSGYVNHAASTAPVAFASRPSHPDVTGETRLPCSETRRLAAKHQIQCVDKLVEAAVCSSSSSPTTNGEANFAPDHYIRFHILSCDVRDAFDLPQTDYGSYNDATASCLDRFVELYLENFWILWPLFPRHNFDPPELHPVLYLVLTSIGAMYGGREASSYGAMIHGKLRDLLAGSLFDLIKTDVESLCLGQARVLTQAAALYFGHKHGFSYAQHIGSVLLAQARHIDLFAGSSQRPYDEIMGEAKTWLNQWVLIESRKRLAFGIMRLEMYTSVLLGSHPLISAEEIDWKLPCTKYLWQTSFKSTSAFIAAIKQDEASGMRSDILFSDLVRIALDKDERLPPLDMLSRELLMIALQENVWRACRQRECLPRLTRTGISYFVVDDGLVSSDVDSASPPPPSKRQRRQSASRSLDDHLVRRSRTMHAIRYDSQQLASTLRRLERSSVMHSDTVATVTDRSCLMSCLLLYHLMLLRLHSDVEALHSISYRDTDRKNNSAALIEQAWVWTQTKDACIAVQHATSIFSLLHKEACQTHSIRAHFNFLTIIGLYHAAVVIWTYAGTHPSQDIDNGGNVDATWVLGDKDHEQYPIVQANSPKVVGLFVRLFDQISPAWSVRSSFAETARRLQTLAFPRPLPAA